MPDKNSPARKAQIAQDLSALAALTQQMAYLGLIVRELPPDYPYTAEDFAVLDAAAQEARLLAHRCAWYEFLLRKNEKRG